MLFVVQVSSDGLFMFCGFGQKVKVMELETGKMKCAIGQVNWSSALIIVLNSWLMPVSYTHLTLPTMAVV